jgi:hypothetical protein
MADTLHLITFEKLIIQVLSCVKNTNNEIARSSKLLVVSLRHYDELPLSPVISKGGGFFMDF